MRDYMKECLDMARWSAADIADLYEPGKRRLPQRMRRAGRFLQTLNEGERVQLAAKCRTLRNLLMHCERAQKGSHHVY